MKRRIFTLAVILAMAASLPLFAGGRQSSGGSTGGQSSTGVDTSQLVTLRMFSISDAPLDQGMQRTWKADFDKMTREKLNAVVEINYAAGNDYANNYRLAMASGIPYDMVHAASGWLQYQDNALKGAYMDLTDLIPRHVPELWDLVGQARWDGVKVNGKIYGVPSIARGYAEPSFWYREDLRLKYNLPEITNMETIERYLQAIKNNEPSLLPSDDYQAQVYGTMWIYQTPYQIIDEQNDRHSNFVLDPKNPRVVLSTLETPEYLPFMHVMKRWQNAGFWPSSVLSSNDWGVFSVNNGKAAASFNGQLTNYSYMVPQTEKEHPGWKMNYFNYGLGNPNSVITGGSSAGTMMSVMRNARNADRALYFALLMHKDQELWRMANYGYEGVHYQITNGKLDTSIQKNPVTDRFNYFAGGIWGDQNFQLDDIADWDQRPKFDEQLIARSKNILDGFVLDLSPIAAEYTAVGQLRMELGFPLQAGLVSDVDAAYRTFRQRSLDAGLETCRKEIERQINAFLDSRGYK
jgi:putative aldouronate transport system substrate-binding protein